MRILHIAATDMRGGAARSLNCLHDALLESGNASSKLVGRSARADPCVNTVSRMSWLGRLSFHGVNMLGLNYAGIFGTKRIAGHPWFQTADVVHYHNLHDGYFNYLALPFLTRLKPSVWTLRDMWALTGHCAYSFDCERWRTGCGRCPYPRTYPPIRRDATHLEWRLKQRTYGRSKVTVLCPSQWLARLAQDSILGGHNIRHVPNGVDTEVYKPADRQALRMLMGWPMDKAILLFAADSFASPFKDYALLMRALQMMAPARKKQVVLATLGENDWKGDGLEGFTILPLGYHDDDVQKARFYGAADVFAFPTRAEVQGRVLLEAMACGCPCVSVNVGGVPEFLRHEQTGYLARAGDVRDFLNGIQTLLDSSALCEEIAWRARRLVVEEYSKVAHCRRMLEVYREVIQERNEETATLRL